MTKRTLFMKCTVQKLMLTMMMALLGGDRLSAQPSGACKLVGDRTGELGCWIIAHDALGAFAEAQTFWHLHTFSSRAEAEAAKGPRGTVMESMGKVWLLTIEAQGWRPAKGQQVAQIGPLPVRPGVNYSAQYMEAIFSPGMTSATHDHSGSEAWYTLEGETCLETPAGKVIGRAGGPPVIVPDDPMHLTATGTSLRRAMVLILHDSAKPSSALVHDWHPKGLCKE
jgi:quercetin dioxygenase-like cupin family protein